MSALLDVKKWVVLFAGNSLKMWVLFDNDMKSGKVCSIICQWHYENVNIDWCLEKCVVLFGSKSLKVSLILDMNSENVFTLMW